MLPYLKRHPQMPGGWGVLVPFHLMAGVAAA